MLEEPFISILFKNKTNFEFKFCLPVVELSVLPNAGMDWDLLKPGDAALPNTELLVLVDAPNTGVLAFCPAPNAPKAGAGLDVDPNAGAWLAVAPNAGVWLVEPNAGAWLVEPNAGAWLDVAPNAGVGLVAPNAWAGLVPNAGVGLAVACPKAKGLFAWVVAPKLKLGVGVAEPKAGVWLDVPAPKAGVGLDDPNAELVWDAPPENIKNKDHTWFSNLI